MAGCQSHSKEWANTEETLEVHTMKGFMDLSARQPCRHTAILTQHRAWFRASACHFARLPATLTATTLRLAVLWLFSALFPSSADAQARQDAGTERVLPVVRDSGVSSYPTEERFNYGGAPRLKTKGIQEFALLDIDTKSLRGRVVESARLHFEVRSKDPQRRLTVSSLTSPWVEGANTRYAREAGASSFRSAREGERAWAHPGSDLSDVSLGAGNSIWGFAESSARDVAGWQSVAVDPRVVAARIAGLSYGFVLFDDVGSEYERRGDEFIYHVFPNRLIASREAGRGHGPYFRVRLGEHDDQAPEPVVAARVETETPDGEPLRGGEARLLFATPRDRGPAGVLGFRARLAPGGVFAASMARDVPQYLVPMAGEPGAVVELRLRDLGLEPGSTHSLSIVAVDQAGNVSAPSVHVVRTSPRRAVDLPAAIGSADEAGDPGELPTLASVRVGVLDPLIKIDPRNGETLPARSMAYRARNRLWSARDRRVRLQAGRNEFVSFQVLCEGPAAHLRADLQFDSHPGDAVTDSSSKKRELSVEVFTASAVATDAGTWTDPLVPLTAERRWLPDARFYSYHVEVWVPHEAPTGVHRGVLRLTNGSDTLDLAVEVDVLEFTLPDRLSFLPVMNCYGLPQPPLEAEYYRLAHRHRTCLERLAYNWRGKVSPPFCPRIKDGKQDWSEFDARFGPLFDGSLFADLPRGPVPVELYYLPLNENWPMDLEAAFRGGYWIEDAFGPVYWQEFRDAARQVVEHLRERGWNETFFEFYLNNKVSHKRQGGWKRSSAPWVFDEPVNTQDFWALRRYGMEFHRAIDAVRGDVRAIFRCDISRPQWQRDLLDGILDVDVVGGAFFRYARRVIDRKARFGNVVLQYGSANPVSWSNAQPVAWCLDAWCQGADGVLPWQTIGKAPAWKKGEDTSLFYPGEVVGHRGPVPSLRLKAFCRGQQDVEYLMLWARETGAARHQVGDAVRAELGLARASFEQRFSEDAGRVRFDGISLERIADLRERIGRDLDRRRPAPRASLREWRAPPRDMGMVPERAPLRKD